MGEVTYDFSGWVTKNNVLCSDGRIIRENAFAHNDGQVVPLVWNHMHNAPSNVIGKVLLENRPEGVFGYGTFNNTEMGRDSKELVQHGDIRGLSIYANRLKQNGPDVIHGTIREVSLVYATANPEASILNVIEHGEEIEDSAIIYPGEELQVYHSEDKVEEESKEMDEKTLEHADSEEKKVEEKAEEKPAEGEETVQDIWDTMNEKQKTVCYALVGQALEDAKGDNSEMKHNLFDGQEEVTNDNALSHEDMELIFKDAPRYGSLKDSFLAHAEGDPVVTYGIQDVDWLFPEAKNLNNPPEWIKRDTGWVQKVMGAVHHTPFSRIKSQFANLTEDEARAKGYIKGHLKKEQVFGLLKRSTTPTTVYKKQKMDRDDIIDITDFNVVAWIKTEMRFMLDEELARAFLIGDGRDASSDDKIDPINIRPVWTDEDLYTVKVALTVAQNGTEDDYAKAFIKAAIKNRKNYKGSGTPTLYTSEDLLAAMLLLEDGLGHSLYKSEQELCTKLRVKEIVTIPQFDGLKRSTNSGDKYLFGLIVNLADYNVGADKGGAVDLFDDFDIDYNQYKYLIETRCSGALVKPFSAIAIECATALPNTVDSVYPIATLRREGPEESEPSDNEG